MTPKEAVGRALEWVLHDFSEAGQIYLDYQEAEGFTAEEYQEMLDSLSEYSQNAMP